MYKRKKLERDAHGTAGEKPKTQTDFSQSDILLRRQTASIFLSPNRTEGRHGSSLSAFAHNLGYQLNQTYIKPKL